MNRKIRKRIVCIGDSNTWGYDCETDTRYGEDIRWTSLLQTMLGDQYTVIEEGLNGRTCTLNDPAEGQKSAYEYIVPCIESHNPFDLLIIMLGTNDMQAKFNLSPEQVGLAMNRLLSLAQACMQYLMKEKNDPDILVISPIVIGDNIENTVECESFAGKKGAEKSKRLARYLEDTARQHNCFFMDASIVADPSPVDQVHLDKEGHRKLAEALYIKVKEVLE